MKTEVERPERRLEHMVVRGTTRSWAMGRDGVKRWADTGACCACDGDGYTMTLGDSGDCSQIQYCNFCRQPIEPPNTGLQPAARSADRLQGDVRQEN